MSFVNNIANVKYLCFHFHDDVPLLGANHGQNYLSYKTGYVALNADRKVLINLQY